MRFVPHPFVAHGANAARRVARRRDAAKDGGDIIAMLEGGDELVALIGIVAQPVQQL